MTTRVFVAKYIRDPRRWEPTNVGVIVARGDDVEARFIGERADGGVDRRSARFVGDTEVFGEWVRYWRRALNRGAEGTKEVLSRRTPNYWVADQGELWFDGEGVELAELARRYFDELVQRLDDEGADASAPQLRQRVDRLLQQAELVKSKGFQRDATIEAVRLDPPEKYKFHYVVANGRITVGQRVSLDPVFVHDVLWKFSHLPENYGRVAFVPGPEAPDELGPTLVHLGRNAHVIDVSSASAEKDVRQAFGPPS
jgi:hypothetical protein